MLIVESAIAATVAALVVSAIVEVRTGRLRSWRGVWLVPAGVVVAAAMMLATTGTARAVIVPTVDLATAANYSVLAGQSVTNTGNSVLAQSAGVSPGSSVTGFPPGIVGGVIDVANPAAAQAQLDLTAAYLDAAGRVLDQTTTAELGGLNLVGGVYAGPSKGALTLTGDLVLDGQGDPTSVFIFQTDSSLITASGSTVSLINGAQECNVFWQVGSSATLATGSTFAGNILALTAVTVATGATVHGRALARNAEVTLDDNVFTTPTCDLTLPTTTTATTTATTVPGATTVPAGATTVPAGATTVPAGVVTSVPGATTPGSTVVGALPPVGVGPTFPLAPTPELPSTGTTTVPTSMLAAALAMLGVIAVLVARRRRGAEV